MKFIRVPVASKAHNAKAKRLFTRFLHSKPGPTAEQLVEVATKDNFLSTRRLISDLAFEAIQRLERERKIHLNDIFYSDQIGILIHTRFDEVWAWLKSRRLSQERYCLILAQSTTDTRSRMVADRLRKVHPVLRSSSYLAIAQKLPNERVAILNQLFGIIGIELWVIMAFLKFPETAVIAGQWMLDKHPSSLTYDDLVKFLVVPELRDEIVGLILKRSIANLSAGSVLSQIACRNSKRGWYLEDNQGLKSINKLLMRLRKYDPLASLYVLQLGTSRQNQRKIVRELIAHGESRLTDSELHEIAKLVEPDQAQKIREHIRHCRAVKRRESRKVDTDKLFDQLQSM